MDAAGASSGVFHDAQRVGEIRVRAVGMPAGLLHGGLASQEHFRDGGLLSGAKRKQLRPVREIERPQALERRCLLGFPDGSLRLAERGGGDDAHAADQGVFQNGRLRIVVDALVGFQHGPCRVTALLAVQAGRGDVDAVRRKAGGDVREHARQVALLHHDRVVLAGDVDVHPVDLADDRRAAAHALAAHFHTPAFGGFDDDIDGVGVLVVVAVGQGGEREVEPRLAGVRERAADAQVVGREAEHAGDQGLVGAVAGQGMREAAEQAELHVRRQLAGQLARHVRDAQRAGGVAARRPHHHRSDDIGQPNRLHARSFALAALCGRFRFRTLYRLAAGARSRLRTVNGSNTWRKPRSRASRLHSGGRGVRHPAAVYARFVAVR